MRETAHPAVSCHATCWYRQQTHDVILLLHRRGRERSRSVLLGARSKPHLSLAKHQTRVEVLDVSDVFRMTIRWTQFCRTVKALDAPCNARVARTIVV